MPEEQAGDSPATIVLPEYQVMMASLQTLGDDADSTITTVLFPMICDELAERSKSGVEITSQLFSCFLTYANREDNHEKVTATLFALIKRTTAFVEVLIPEGQVRQDALTSLSRGE